MTKTSWKVLLLCLRAKYMLQGEKVVTGDNASQSTKLIQNFTTRKVLFSLGQQRLEAGRDDGNITCISVWRCSWQPGGGWWDFGTGGEASGKRGAAAAPVHGPPWASSSLSRLAALPRQESCSSARQGLPSTGFWKELHCIKTPPLLC